MLCVVCVRACARVHVCLIYDKGMMALWCIILSSLFCAYTCE